MQTWGPSGQPPILSLGQFVGSGASLFANAGCGFQWSFSPTGDDEILGQIALPNYGGGDLAIVLYWQIFSAATAGETVKWETDYAFIRPGDDGWVKVDGNLVDEIVVGEQPQDQLFSTQLSTMEGVDDAQLLNLTLRRNSSGGGADTYDGAADLYRIALELV